MMGFMSFVESDIGFPALKKFWRNAKWTDLEDVTVCHGIDGDGYTVSGCCNPAKEHVPRCRRCVLLGSVHCMLESL